MNQSTDVAETFLRSFEGKHVFVQFGKDDRIDGTLTAWDENALTIDATRGGADTRLPPRHSIDC
jgi:hypothetical protein